MINKNSLEDSLTENKYEIINILHRLNESLGQMKNDAQAFRFDFGLTNLDHHDHMTGQKIVCFGVNNEITQFSKNCVKDLTVLTWYICF